jgi:hypothetical protein
MKSHDHVFEKRGIVRILSIYIAFNLLVRMF